MVGKQFTICVPTRDTVRQRVHGNRVELRSQLGKAGIVTGKHHHHAVGTIVLNSTVGLTAAFRNRPVVCLGPSIFDISGLTAQQPLSAFWHDPPFPDAALCRDYLAVITAACLVNGNFYTEDGVKAAVAGSLARILDDSDLLADAPKRRKRIEEYKTRAAA